MKKKKAFTLLELIISLAMVSVIVLIINAMFIFNFKISKDFYKLDESNKEANNAMLFIENVVREADKIEKIDNKICNFQARLGESKYRFAIDKNNKLKAIINGSKGKGTNWIGSVNDMMLTYNGEDEVFLWIEGLNGEIYQTTINIGIRQ